MPLMARALSCLVSVDAHRTVLHGAQPPAEPEDHAPRLLHEDAERAVVDLQGTSQTSLPQPRGDDHAPWYVCAHARAVCVISTRPTPLWCCLAAAYGQYSLFFTYT